jgi:prepilin-type N-terminal cleavage/methylation domain-containing protein
MLMHKNNNGFTLIELSIVLVIIGLLVSLGANMIGPLTTFVKVRESRDIMDADLQSVISWSSSRNTIPNETSFPTVVKSPLDAWGRNLIYLYDANLYSATPTKDTICGRRSTGLTLITTDPAATINNVAFTVLSGADNATLKSTLGATPITASGAVTGTINVTGPNSDLVRWVTLDELRSKIGCQGAPLKIVNNELPFGAVGSIYTATISADGGVPFPAPPATFKWCIETAAALPFSFTPTRITPANSCSALTEASWNQAATLSISSTPAAGTQNSYSFTVYVRDNDNNIAQKMFVLTNNPQ